MTAFEYGDRRVLKKIYKKYSLDQGVNLNPIVPLNFFNEFPLNLAFWRITSEI